jgi:hypothetical protein
MKRFSIILVFLLLGPLAVFGQTKEETMAYITSEFKSFETPDYIFAELAFSPSGDAFTIRRKSKGKKEYVITIPLKTADVYMVTLNHANGINKHYLVARSLGKDTLIAKDGAHVRGDFKITPAMDNEGKCQALERAFTRLTVLTTGRKFLFSTP